MKKLGCAKCGGVKKMKVGGSAVAKAPVNMYGIPQENMGTSSQMGFGRKGGVVKKLPKAQLGSIVKAFTKFAKPVAKNIIKDTKVAVRPVNRTANPVVKKLDPKIVRRTLNDSRHIKELKKELKSDRKIAKVALGVGSTAGTVGTGVIIDAMTDKKAKAKIKPKKK